MKQKIIITILLLSVSVCCAQKKRDRDFIYKPNKVFVFHAKYDSAGMVTENYIVMRILEKKVDNQLVIIYNYYDEKPERDTIYPLSSSRFARISETALILEDNKSIQLYPPRSRYHQLRSCFPLPEISFPIKIGKKYTINYISFHNPLCHCKLNLDFRMRISADTQYLYQDRLIDVYRISGYANSKYGNFDVLYLFNEELGFVKWVYRRVNISLELNLIEQF